MKRFSQVLKDINLFEATKKWKAGGFPYVIEGDRIYVCLFVSNNPAYGGAAPQIPKGHPDPGEKPMYASAREASEETGMPLRLLLKNPMEVSVRQFKGEVSNYIQHVWAFELDRKITPVANDEGIGVWLETEKALRTMRRDQRIFLQDFLNKVI